MLFLLERMLDKDPEKRYTIDDVLASDWLRDCDCSDYVNIYNENYEANILPCVITKPKKNDKRTKFKKIKQMLGFNK